MAVEDSSRLGYVSIEQLGEFAEQEDQPPRFPTRIFNGLFSLPNLIEEDDKVVIGITINSTREELELAHFQEEIGMALNLDTISRLIEQGCLDKGVEGVGEKTVATLADYIDRRFRFFGVDNRGEI